VGRGRAAALAALRGRLPVSRPTGVASIFPLILSIDTSTEPKVYFFRATLIGVRGVSRKLAARGDRTLEDLHGLLQTAYNWDDDHLYVFWPSGRFWDRESGPGFGRPDCCRDSGDRSARVRLDRLGLEVGQTVAYVFDFGDEWRVRLKLVDVRETDGVPAMAILESRGEAPPQYWNEEDLGDAA
jgi:Plasmid pRiA4b ORF-3-like protein